MSDETVHMLELSGLMKLHEHVEKGTDKMAREPGLDDLSVRSVMHAIDTYLTNAAQQVGDRMCGLRDVQLRQDVIMSCLQSYHTAYTKIVKAVTSPSSGFESPHSMVRRSPNDVAVALGV